MISGISGSMNFPQMPGMNGQMGNPFERIDSNGDGSLDATEVASMADRLSEIKGESVNADEIMSKLDSDSDGLITEAEFAAGRPAGPPPGMTGMMGGGMKGGLIQSLMGIESESEESESTESTISLDTNGDGIVDAEEAAAGLNSVIQEYLNQMPSVLNLGSESASQLNLTA